jgi:hypothetical protein
MMYAALFVAAGIAGCASTSSSVVSTGVTDRSAAGIARNAYVSTRTWILQGPGGEAALMAGQQPGISFLGQKFRQVFYPSKANVTPPPSWHVLTWYKFNSVAALQAMLTANPGPNRLPTNVQVVGYDNEGGQLNMQPWTPYNEWATCTGNPPNQICTANDALIESSMQRFAKLAHAYKQPDGTALKVVFMPAADLWQQGYSDKYQAYLASGVVSATAAYADYYHIQAQGLELNLAQSQQDSFQNFVSTMVTQIQKASPTTTATAGVTTYVNGTTDATSQNIAAAVEATSSMVSGYWPNDVANSNGTQDAVLNGAIQLLSTASPAP